MQAYMMYVNKNKDHKYTLLYTDKFERKYTVNCVKVLGPRVTRTVSDKKSGAVLER